MILDKTRHIKYWLRCLKTLLPRQYIGNDSNRMLLAYFILGALDLLDVTIPADDLRGYVDWIFYCQHPDGGFRMWPGTKFGDRANETNAQWDPANVPATYFALAALLSVGDDLKRVKRKATLRWLRRMQRPDGSFGETLIDGRVEGGRDPRFGYCATGIRHILRLPLDEGPDIDLDGLTRCIKAAESYDGGIADQPFHEPHAGYTFCSLGALAFMDRLQPTKSQHVITNDHSSAATGPTDSSAVVRWLVSRQTDLLDPDDEVIETAFPPSQPIKPPNNAADNPEPPAHQSPSKSTAWPVLPSTDCTGMNGRTNKVADTCYAFWVGASLQLLGQLALCDKPALRTYLLEKTQHPILGGFGKFPGDLPDLYHSYLGLAALSLTGSGEVKMLHGGMCLSEEASARLPDLREGWDE